MFFLRFILCLLPVWALQVPVRPKIVSVADYGAIPNDDTDDRAAIQRAIDASRPGQTVQFEPGVYNLDRHIVFRSRRNYVGKDSNLRAGDDTEFSAFLEDNGQEIQISGLRFERAGLFLGGGQRYRNIRIVSNHFADMPDHAIKITVDSDQVAIERNTFENIRGYGAIVAYNVNRLSYSFNRMIDSKHGGHILGPRDDCKFNNNRMTGLSIMGLEIQRMGQSVSRNMQVIGNVIYDWKEPLSGAIPLSIVAEMGQNTQIKDNYVCSNIADGSDWGQLNKMGKVFGVAIEAGFESGVVEGNITGGPWPFTNHVGAGGRDMPIRNNKFYGKPAWRAWIESWPSVYGKGTFVETDNLKDPDGMNIPPPPATQPTAAIEQAERTP